MKKYILTEEQKDEIIYYLKNHSTLSVGRLLNQLEELKDEKEKFRKELEAKFSLEIASNCVSIETLDKIKELINKGKKDEKKD